MVVARLVKLTVGFTWEDEAERGSSHWSFGSVEAARKWVEKYIEKSSDVAWYSIEEEEYIPCDENDPSGHLYIGCGYYDFVDLEVGNA